MKKISCEICGIKTCKVGDNKRVFMAKFPLDEERCKQWVKATGKEDLVYVPIEKLHQLKYLCQKHFRSKDFKKKKTQLKKTAIPSLEISSTPLSDDILIGFPLHCIVSNQPLPARRTDNVQLSYSELSLVIKKEHDYQQAFLCEPMDISGGSPASPQSPTSTPMMATFQSVSVDQKAKRMFKNVSTQTTDNLVLKASETPTARVFVNSSSQTNDPTDYKWS